MKRILLFLLSILFFTGLTTAQKGGLKFINRTDLKSYIDFFASDELKGRETGTNENDIAALFLQTNMKRLGLSPDPESKSYLQGIPFRSVDPDPAGTSLRIEDNNGMNLFTTDSIISLMPAAKSFDLEGKVVFAGYGYVNDSIGYNDLKETDLADKIVIIMTRNPELVRSMPEPADYILSENVESPKIGAILMRKPKAILFVYDAKDRFPDAYSSGLAEMLGGGVTLGDKPLVENPFRLLFITRNTANKLLLPTGFTLMQLQDSIDTYGKPVSQEIGNRQVKIQVAIKVRKFTGYNVIGLIEGSDPILKNECIVYSAHFDHEGINEKGEAFNGADDNASGSVGLLEVAEAFMSLKKKPMRTIIFTIVNGEEKGLLGSQYYVDNPVFPMEKTILNINLDMIGRSITPSDTGKFMGFDLTVTKPGEIQMFSDINNPQLSDIIKRCADESGIQVTDKGERIPFGSSDHASFAAKGVPFLFFHSGIHADLHSVRDDPEKIDFDKMEKVSRLVYLVGYEVANQKNIDLTEKPEQ
jgi:hypothetical protein